VVFVTAYDEHAVEAFDLRAADYVLKPVRPERLAEAVRRVLESVDAPPTAEPPADESIAVELGGVTRFITRSEVRFAEAHGDYARLHTADGSHLVRVPLSTLEEQWSTAGFVRIHRRYLVALAHVDEVAFDAGRGTVRVGGDELAVSRRHLRELRDTLVRRARPGREDGR
jgi:DNA-binding LytR/AlgR family response regulator